VIQYGNAAFGGVKYAYVNRAFAYRDKGQCELALADFNKAISMRATSASAYRGRGSVLLCLKRYDEALADLNQAIEKDPDSAWAYIYRGRVHLAQGDRARAQADFDQAVKLDGELAEVVAQDLAR
jgi:tetratricopeptide (TPR) repeat protein